MDRPSSDYLITSDGSVETAKVPATPNDKLAADLSRRANQDWIATTAETIRRLALDPDEMAKIEARSF